ncbi:hypothetical protein DFQ28_005279 [Apophysomyces sp. BC1034]|nr:hypothetical protein DFQ30_004079 [Apophysomyces sp. BC1015]KAG0177920.1 hypothetical protein DFQ29_004157 [Apophysomyces sp. BC1021]KAG0188182.1 hypothetical protein DFQ28_005279 [Apophysomyces sp. BC1034]
MSPLSTESRQSVGNGISPVMHPVKSEPLSPPPLRLTSTERHENPMALDKVLSSSGAGSPHVPRSGSAEHPNKRQKLPVLPKPMHTVSSQSLLPTPPSTLLAKRLGTKQGKHTRNLTIFAPSYTEQHHLGIRSAPLNSNFNKQPSTSTSVYPHPLSKTALAPLMSPSSSPRKQEFAIPPIVPSQQHQRPCRPATAVPTLPPKTPTTTSFAALQRQQFLQPFEHLFDTIETTRSLKSTLDDQIRRSSSLIQTLQASSTTIEGLVRNQIKEAMAGFEESLEVILQRIEALEVAMGKSPQKKPATKPMINGLRSPPTIVRSQNDIAPQEYQSMLNTLRERLDRLESQLDA